MKQYIETIYSLSRIVIACIMICLQYASCQMAGWLILDFCLALFFIQRIDNKRMLTLVIVVQLIITILLFITLNTFTAVKTSPVTTFSTVNATAQDTFSDRASGAGNIDVTFGNTSNGGLMSLTTDITKFPVLLVYDNNLIENANITLTAVDLNDTFSKKKIASIFGLKPKQVKAFLILKGNDATSIWGTKGFNGVFEVLSPTKYRQLKREGKIDKRYKLAK